MKSKFWTYVVAICAMTVTPQHNMIASNSRSMKAEKIEKLKQSRERVQSLRQWAIHYDKIFDGNWELAKQKEAALLENMKSFNIH